MPVGTTGSQYLAAIDPLLISVQSDRRLQAIRRNRMYLDIIKGLGTYGDLIASIENVKNTIYYDWMENPLNPPLDTTGATITGNGTLATPFSVTGLGASAQDLVVVGDTLTLVSGRNVRVMTVPTAASFTAQTVDGASATWTAGQWAMITSQGASSGSDAPNPKRWGVTKISNLIQNIRTTTQITDVAQGQEIEVEIEGKRYILPYESIQCATMHYGNIMGAIYQGQLSSTQFTDASPTISGTGGRGVQYTRGLRQYATTFGFTDAVASLGTVALTDVADMINGLRAARADNEYLLTGSTQSMIAYSNLLKGLASSGALQSLRLQVDGRELDFETEVFKYGGMTLHLKTLNYLDNNEQVGTGASASTGTPARKEVLWTPVGNIKSVGGAPTPLIRIARLPEPVTTGPNRTMSMDGLVVETRYGNLAQVATNGSRTLTIDNSSSIGLRVANPQVLGLQTVLS